MPLAIDLESGRPFVRALGFRSSLVLEDRNRNRRWELVDRVRQADARIAQRFVERGVQCIVRIAVVAARARSPGVCGDHDADEEARHRASPRVWSASAACIRAAITGEVFASRTRNVVTFGSVDFASASIMWTRSKPRALVTLPTARATSSALVTNDVSWVSTSARRARAVLRAAASLRLA